MNTTCTIDVLFADLTKIPHGERFTAKIHGPSDYEYMASFTVLAPFSEASLHEVYAATQNITAPWRTPPCRSSSVGDIFRVRDGRCHYMVDRIGFKAIITPTFLDRVGMAQADKATPHHLPNSTEHAE